MIKVIDNQFNLLGVIDNYTSFLAGRNYYNIGKFELHLTFNEEYLEILVEENIIFITPDKPYVILYREIDTDNKMIIRGEELKNYTSRWITKPPIGQAYHRVNSNVETIMKEYVSTNCETPNLVVATNLNRGETIVFQTRYKQLDEELEKIGLVSGIGWIVKLDLDNKQFIFDIVEGLDRTEGQDINSRAIFSTDFDNVSNQTLLESKLGYKNVAIVAGQGQGVDREIQVIGNATGFDRFETFVDARDIEDTTDLPDRGLQKLSEMDKVLSFENEILTNSSLIYEEDYNVGDKVTIKNKKWNVTLDSIITSITEIYEGNNFRLSATFGNTLPTFQEVLKRKLDAPIAESGGGGEGIEVINNLESTAIDKPLSANMGRELFTSVSNGKSLIAGAITDKGVDTSPSDSFNVMADNIGEIKSGDGLGDIVAGNIEIYRDSNIYANPKTPLYNSIVNFDGELRLSFSIKPYNQTHKDNAHGQVYINGIPEGILRTPGTNIWVNFIEDFAVNVGDVITIVASGFYPNFSNYTLSINFTDIGSLITH